MLIVRRLSLVGAAAATVAVAACSSSSTAPSPITPAQLAEHFDSLYVAAVNDSNSAGEFIIPDFVEFGPAVGGNEVSATVTTASGAQTWHGVGFAGVITDDTVADTIFVVALYPNRDLQQVVFADFENSGGNIFGATANGFDTVWTNGTLNSASGSIVSTGATCSLQTGLAADPIMQEFAGEAFSCVSAKFNVSLSATFPGGDNLGALASVSISNVTFNGAELTLSGASHVVAIPSRAAAALMQLKSVLHH
jgi:hypothetical protein